MAGKLGKDHFTNMDKMFELCQAAALEQLESGPKTFYELLPLVLGADAITLKRAVKALFERGLVTFNETGRWQVVSKSPRCA